MSAKGEVFPNTNISVKFNDFGNYFLNFIAELEKSSGFIPEIYIRSNESYDIAEIKYFDIATGDFLSSVNPSFRIDELFSQKTLIGIYSNLKKEKRSNFTINGQVWIYTDNYEKNFEARFSLAKDKSLLLILKENTEKKKIEENILKLKQALDSTGDIILITDREGIITQVNPAFLKLYGYAEGEIIGKVTPRVLKSNAITAEQYKEFWDSLISKKSMKVEIINKTKDGRELYIEGTADPILNENGEIIGFLEIQRDITNRKISENALKQSELRFRSIWEKSFDGMRLTDKNGIMISVNAAFCKLVDMPEGELINKSFNIIYKQTDQERKENLNEYKVQFEERKFVNFRWNNFVLHNGKSVFLNVSFSFIDSGSETLVLSIFRDVTKYKKSEEELRNAERLAAIGTMAAYLSHEIKNPLATIKNYVEILFENEQLTEEVKEPLQVIHDTVKRLNRLLTDVLQYARNEEFIEVEIEVKVMVDNVIEMLKKQLKNKNITIKNSVKDVIIAGDYMSMISVFTNLIENSIDAVSENGEVIISGKKNKIYNSIFIKDNGCGVVTDKKIFDPFITTKSSGTGLGLAIVDKIMKYHNGTIELLSSKSGETIFELKFYEKGANGEDTNN